MQATDDSLPLAPIPLPQRHSAPPEAGNQWLLGLVPLWRHAVLPYLGTRLIVVVVELLANFYVLGAIKPHAGKPSLALNTHFPGLIWQNWQHFDGGFYLQIAAGGYPTSPPQRPYSIWEFYPLYPILTHPLGRAFGGTWSAYSIAGLLIANLAALVAVCYLFVLVRREFDERVASRAVIFQSLFPASFFLSAIYTESIFLATAIACLYYTRERRWLPAGICGALATLARGPGILLLVPVGWAFWQTLRERCEPAPPLSGTWQERLLQWWATRVCEPARAATERDVRHTLPAVLLIPLAQLAFMLYARIQSGEFWANLIAARIWKHRFTWPWQPVIHDLIQHPPPTTTPWTYNLPALSAALLVVFAVCVVWSFVRLPAIYALYGLLMFLAPLSSGYITSLPRYFLVIFPAFICLARWADPEEHLGRYTFLIVTFAVLLALLTTFYELGFQISGA